MPPPVLEPLDHQRTRLVPIDETDGQKLANRRMLFQRYDQLLAELVGLDPIPDLLRQITRNDPAALQGPQPLQYDRNRGYRAQNDRPHEAAAGADDLPHCVLFRNPSTSGHDT